jgi:hypothetical protein
MQVARLTALRRPKVTARANEWREAAPMMTIMRLHTITVSRVSSDQMVTRDMARFTTALRLAALSMLPPLSTSLATCDWVVW